MDPVTNTWLYKVLIHEASVGLCLVDDCACCAGVALGFFLPAAALAVPCSAPSKLCIQFKCCLVRVCTHI